MAMQEGSESDVVERLRLLADWVQANEHANPELRIFATAAEEIERLRRRIERISKLAEDPDLHLSLYGQGSAH